MYELKKAQDAFEESVKSLNNTDVDDLIRDFSIKVNNACGQGQLTACSDPIDNILKAEKLSVVLCGYGYNSGVLQGPQMPTGDGGFRHTFYVRADWKFIISTRESYNNKI